MRKKREAGQGPGQEVDHLLREPDHLIVPQPHLRTKEMSWNGCSTLTHSVYGRA